MRGQHLHAACARLALGKRCASLKDNSIRVDNPAAFTASWQECPSLRDLEYGGVERGK